VAMRPQGVVPRAISPDALTKVHVVAPARFGDAKEIADCLKSSRPVIAGYILRRLAFLPLTLLLVAFATFVVLRLTGNPVDIFLDINRTPEQVADLIQDWIEEGVADGFNLMPPVLPEMLDRFIEHVVPILQKRGLFRTAYEGDTLRSHFGLSRPDVRYS